MDGSTTVPSGGKRRFQFVYNVHKKVETCLEAAFYQLGRGVAKVPTLAVIIPILVAVAVSGGFAFLGANDNPNFTWVPQDSDAARHKSTIKPYFGPTVHRYLVYVTRKSGQEPTLVFT